MAFAKYPPENISEAITVFKQDVELAHGIVHGDENTEVLTEKGLVPSFKKVIDTFEVQGQQVISEFGWTQVGTFAAGFTFTSPNQVGQDVDGNWWRWNDTFPKVVTAGTLPSSDANYKLVGDGVLRGDLAAVDSTVLVGGVGAGKLGRKYSDEISVLDLIPESEHAAIKNRTSEFDCTPFFQFALDNYRSIFIPDGAYWIDTLYVPDSPSDQLPRGGKFYGSPDVWLIQRSIDTPLIKKISSLGRAYNWTIGPFAVIPKFGQNSTVDAIYTSGCTGFTYENIQGISNATYGFYSLFNCSAAPYLSYANTFNKPTMLGCRGWNRMFNFNSDGQGAGFNSNANTINDPLIYNCPDLVYGIHANESYGLIINNPIIEANPACTAIVMGNGMVVNQGSLEFNLHDFDYSGLANLASNTLVQYTYLGTARTVDFGNRGSYGNLWVGVVEAAGECEWINENGKGNKKYTFVYSDNPSTPTFSQTTGTSGVLSAGPVTITQDFDPMTRNAKFRLTVQFNPADTGNVSITPALPEGWSLRGCSATGIDAVSGTPCVGAVSDTGVVFFKPASTDAHFIYYQFDLYK